MWRKVLVHLCESIHGGRISFHKQTLSSCTFACSLLFLCLLPSSLIRTCYLSSYQTDLHVCCVCYFCFCFSCQLSPKYSSVHFRHLRIGCRCRLQQELYIQRPQSVNLGPANCQFFLFYSNYLCISEHSY